MMPEYALQNIFWNWIKNSSLINIQLTVDIWTFNSSVFTEHWYVLLQVDPKDNHKRLKLENVTNW